MSGYEKTISLLQKYNKNILKHITITEKYIVQVLKKLAVPTTNVPRN